MAIDPDVQVELDKLIARIEALEAQAPGGPSEAPLEHTMVFPDGTTITYRRQDVP